MQARDVYSTADHLDYYYVDHVAQLLDAFGTIYTHVVCTCSDT